MGCFLYTPSNMVDHTGSRTWWITRDQEHGELRIHICICCTVCPFPCFMLLQALLGEQTEALRGTLKELLENMLTLRGQVRKLSDLVCL